MRWLSPRKQMTYAQWLEQTRRQAAERQAEADATAEEGEADESDLWKRKFWQGARRVCLWG